MIFNYIILKQKITMESVFKAEKTFGYKEYAEFSDKHKNIITTQAIVRGVRSEQSLQEFIGIFKLTVLKDLPEQFYEMMVDSIRSYLVCCNSRYYIADIVARMESALPDLKKAIVSKNLDLAIELISQFTPRDFKSRTYEADLQEYYGRGQFTKNLSWAIPDRCTIMKIAEFIVDKTTLEVGSGNGLWAGLLRAALGDNNGTVIPTDNFSSHSFKQSNCFIQVENLDSLEAVRKYSVDVLLLIWPPYGDSMAIDCLREFSGNFLVYIGEGEGGCTADDAFHQCLDEQWKEIDCFPLKTWDSIHDHLMFYTRKE